jgi:hypothetical protein
VIQSIEPFMSAEDIRAGQRWASEIGAKLAEVNFALLCLTPTNLDSKWIHFEAGAVSKNLAQGRVSGLLLDVSATQIEFPLQQFQHTPLSKDALLKLVQELNKHCAAPLPESRVQTSFQRGFPDFEKSLVQVRQVLAHEQKDSHPSRGTNDILTDVLTAQQGLATKLDALEENVRLALNYPQHPRRRTRLPLSELELTNGLVGSAPDTESILGETLSYLNQLEDTKVNRDSFLAAIEARFGSTGRETAKEALDLMRGRVRRR